MRIAPNAEMLEIKGENGVLYPVLTWDDREIVLIDTGFPGQIELFREAIEMAGFSLWNITKVILTHQDMDHIGCAKLLAELGAEMLAHEAEAPYIQGDRTAVKLAAMEERLPEMTPEERAFYERLKAGAPRFFTHIDTPLKDGQTLDFCGGITVIHTPGHTPGHIALRLNGSGIIVAGDAASMEGGALTGANPQYTQDTQKAQASFEKLLALRPSAVVCYHGGLYTV